MRSPVGNRPSVSDAGNGPYGAHAGDDGPKVAFLSEPRAYPVERPARVTRIETHMSWVFLTERFVYKLKKPVRYPFLDFSTLSARRRDCEAEVRLNRRLAPRIYLGTLALTADAGDRLCLGGRGRVVEWLVVMHRLAAEWMLDNVMATGTVRDEDLLPAAALLAAFYRDAPPVPLPRTGYVARLDADLEETFVALAAPGMPLPAESVERVVGRLRRLLGRHPRLLERRVEAGRIVEGHGDLRPEHVWLGRPPAIIDCLEFNRSFRIVDPVEELASLTVECQRLRAPERVAELFVEVYRERARDAAPDVLWSLHASRRALLRAKLAGWHLREPGPRGAAHWEATAQAYLRLAEAHAEALA
jgi:uncharacterized protein